MKYRVLIELSQYLFQLWRILETILNLEMYALAIKHRNVLHIKIAVTFAQKAFLSYGNKMHLNPYNQVRRDVNVLPLCLKCKYIATNVVREMINKCARNSSNEA